MLTRLRSSLTRNRRPARPTLDCGAPDTARLSNHMLRDIGFEACADRRRAQSLLTLYR